jgi:acetyltransferase-like isoleucine patch superfamily enzyme
MSNIVFIIYHFLWNLFSKIIRQFYWLYRLSRCEIGKGVKLEFPVIIEGAGKFIFNDGMTIRAKVNLGAGQGAVVSFGKNSELQGGVYLRVGVGAILKFGAKSSLGKGTTIYSNSNWQIGDDVVIASNCSLQAREPGKNGEFLVGNNSYIGDNTIIDLTSNVEIGNSVAIGPNCTLYTHDHDYKSATGIAAWKSPVITHPIRIEDGAWIGSNVTVLPGVIIGSKAVVASGAVVTKSVDSRTVVGGVPAKILSNYEDED